MLVVYYEYNHLLLLVGYGLVAEVLLCIQMRRKEIKREEDAQSTETKAWLGLNLVALELSNTAYV